MDFGEEKQNQDNKRRRLQLLASEKKLLDKFPEGCLHNPSRHDRNRILSALEFGPTTKESCTIDASGIINAVHVADESPHDEDAEKGRWRMMHEGMEFWDDVNALKSLNWELAVQARMLKMEFFKKMGVYKEVLRDVAKKMGCKVITTNCVDTNKGDTSRPNYRSRLVGREVKYDKRLDLFSAALPLETLKFLCSMYARGQICPEPYRLAVIDIKRAYFNALARRPIFIEIPQTGLELGDEGCLGQLQLSLYGTRDAAQNWAHEYTTFLPSIGFQVGRASPCNFTHRPRRVHLTVHGDCFTVMASAKQIAWLGKAMKKRYGSAGAECWTDGRSSSSHPLDKNRIGVRARSATRREDHFRVGDGNVQDSVHTSRARQRVSVKSDDS